LLLVIFGAGASYDSYYPSPPGTMPSEPFEGARPPLTNELFSRGFDYAISEFWQIRPLTAGLRRLPSNASLEEQLERLYDQRSELHARQRQFAALRFYLQRIMRRRSRDWLDGTAGVTNYAELLGRIEDWRAARGERVAFITFNYDTLLDEAFRDVQNFDPASANAPELPGYTRDTDCLLFKPHGSCNWGRRVSHVEPQKVQARTIPEGLISYVESLDLGEDFEILREYDDGSTVDFRSKQGPSSLLLPALAVPLRSKSSLESPPAHIALLKECLSTDEVTHVIVIGWRATESPFLALWTSLRTLRLQIVDKGQQNAEAITARLRQSGLRLVESLPAVEGFSRFLEADDLETFLTLPPA